jgi:hypothetical protein
MQLLLVLEYRKVGSSPSVQCPKCRFWQSGKYSTILVVVRVKMACITKAFVVGIALIEEDLDPSISYRDTCCYYGKDDITNIR